MPLRKGPKREHQPRPSDCIVCGDPAIGHNYDAPSCASCKAFFRRVVIRNRMFTGCMRGGLCEGNESMPPCRACRYDKCIKGGMNPLLVAGAEIDIKPEISRISTTEENKPSTSHSWSLCTKCSTSTQKATVECQTDTNCEHIQSETAENSSHELPRLDAETIPCDPGTSSESNALKQMLVAQNPDRIENKLEKMMRILMAIEDAHQKLRISKYTPKLVPGLSLDDFAHGRSKLGVKFKPFQPMHSRAYELTSMPIVPYEVIIGQRIAMDLTDFDYKSKKLWMFQDVTYSIEFIKALSIYHAIDDCSKKVLLASALTCSNFTSAYYSYSHNSDRTFFPDGSVMTWNNELQNLSPDSTRFHTGIIAAMKEADLDTREYTLLKLIIVCNPLLHGLHPHDITLLQHEKEKLTKTLLSYVLARRGIQEGPSIFAKILSIGDVVTRLTSWQKSQCILIIAMNLYKNYTPFDETVFHSQTLHYISSMIYLSAPSFASLLTSRLVLVSASREE
ncbi:hypothetical protein PRIPAC_96995 [Pristionchus pacificus]|uniref:Nuclear receptor n=1 Tax=Pristionchus pacificus TaxID=54126 RepID=A0A2A6BCE6_PRIPA|nr:hypothetical protein PRIPAC_96995 [Pristionchus pacificus]|eukprot:PDM63553.1 nuclear receptor [Pristionchus pacificus]